MKRKSKKYYSPRLNRELISRLYHAAKAQRMPMTKLANLLIAAGLTNQTASVSEEPVIYVTSKVTVTKKHR